MGFREAESSFMISIHAEVTLSELIDDGPEPFGERARELLEAQLKLLLDMDWKKGRRPSRAPDASAP